MRSKKEFLKKNIQKIEVMISNHRPISEIARTLNVKYETLKRFLISNDIPYELNQHRKGIPHEESRKDALYYINGNNFITTSKLRQKLIEDGIKECKCERCGKSEWMGMPIPLELHHKNFNHYDNSLDNLELLCSNCHMQIHGYSNVTRKTKKEKIIVNDGVIEKKIKQKQIKEMIICPICGKVFTKKHKNQKYCSQQCSHKSQRKIKNVITKEILIKKFIELKSFSGVGKYFNINDKGIIKWFRKFDLPTKYKEMLNYINNIP